MNEIRTVVAGVDRDAPSSNALAWAADEAASSNARLEIRPVNRAGDPAPFAARRHGAVLQLAHPLLRREVRRVRARLGPDRVTVSAAPGYPGEQLVDAGGDLLVVGAGRAHRSAATSTIHWVAAHASCSVVVVKTGPPASGAFADHVVVGVDGSEPSRAALAFAFRYAADHELPLTAVHATDTRQAVPPDNRWRDDRFKEDRLDARRTTATSLEAEVEPYARRHPTVAVKRAVCYGDPTAALVRAAAGARLLVIGDRGLNALARMPLGSVSEALLDEATGSIAVIRSDPGLRTP